MAQKFVARTFIFNDNIKSVWLINCSWQNVHFIAPKRSMTRFLVLLASLEASLMLNTIGNFYVLPNWVIHKKACLSVFRWIPYEISMYSQIGLYTKKPKNVFRWPGATLSSCLCKAFCLIAIDVSILEKKKRFSISPTSMYSEPIVQLFNSCGVDLGVGPRIGY